MKPRILATYDEITRQTVLEPDGSQRPFTHTAANDRQDRAVREAVADALIANGLTAVGFEVDQGKVILRGWIRDAAHVAQVLRVVTKAAPDLEIDDRMHIGQAGS